MARSLAILCVVLSLLAAVFSQYTVNVCLPNWNCSASGRTTCVSRDRAYSLDCHPENASPCGVPECGSKWSTSPCPAAKPICNENQVCTAVAWVGLGGRCDTRSGSTLRCYSQYRCQDNTPSDYNDFNGTCIPTSGLYGFQYYMLDQTNLMSLFHEVRAVGDDCSISASHPASGTNGACGPNLFCRSSSGCQQYATFKNQSGCTATCTTDSLCTSGLCVSGTCKDSWLKVGDVATNASQCLSGTISGGRCSGTDCTTVTCTSPQVCGLYTGTYQCIDDSSTCTSAQYFNGKNCITKLASGVGCTATTQCSGDLVCSGGTCKTATTPTIPSPPAQQFPPSTTQTFVPSAPRVQGGICNSTFRCETNLNCIFGVCRSYSATAIPIGSQCSQSISYFDCEAGGFCNMTSTLCQAFRQLDESCESGKDQCVSPLYCKGNFTTPYKCAASPTYGQPCGWTTSMSENCSIAAIEFCMCLGTSTPRCYKLTDPEYKNYDNPTNQITYNSITAPSDPAYVAPPPAPSGPQLYNTMRTYAAQGNEYACSQLPAAAACESDPALILLQRSNGIQRYADVINALSPQCKSAIAANMCCGLCEGKGAAAADYFMTQGQTEKWRLFVNDDYNISAPMTYLHQNGAYTLSCTGTPTVTVTASACSTYSASLSGASPTQIVSTTCGSRWTTAQLNATYIMSITVTSDASEARIKAVLDSVFSGSGADARSLVNTSTDGKKTYYVTVTDKDFLARGMLNFVMMNFVDLATLKTSLATTGNTVTEITATQPAIYTGSPLPLVPAVITPPTGNVPTPADSTTPCFLGVDLFCESPVIAPSSLLAAIALALVASLY